jgi:hypothetical protein
LVFQRDEWDTHFRGPIRRGDKRVAFVLKNKVWGADRWAHNLSLRHSHNIHISSNQSSHYQYYPHHLHSYHYVANGPPVQICEKNNSIPSQTFHYERNKNGKETMDNDSATIIKGNGIYKKRDAPNSPMVPPGPLVQRRRH